MHLLSSIERRLDQMLNEVPPAMWGGPEAFELQVILLLELVYHRNASQRFILLYVAFLRARHPELGPRALSSICPDYDVLVRELRAFRSHLEGERRAQVLG